MSARLRPTLSLRDEFVRIAGGEIDKALALLTDADLERGTMLHETRKRIKKIRAILRLTRPGCKRFCKAEDIRHRDTARSIAGGRDATALVETVQRLIRAFPADTAEGELDAIHEALIDGRDRALERNQSLDAALGDAIASLRAGRRALADLAIPDDPEAAARVLAKGAVETVKAARNAIRAAGDRGEPEDFHDLRKAVKRHWTQLALLGDLWPEAVAPRRRQLKDLGEALGELNDIDLLRTALGGIDGDDAFDASAAQAERLMARREKALRKRTLARAELLFALRPRAVRDAIREAWIASADRTAPARGLREAIALAG